MFGHVSGISEITPKMWMWYNKSLVFFYILRQKKNPNQFQKNVSSFLLQCYHLHSLIISFNDLPEENKIKVFKTINCVFMHILLWKALIFNVQGMKTKSVNLYHIKT